VRKLLVSLVLALALAPAAGAAPPDRTAPDPAQPPAEAPTLVEAPHAISILQLPDVKHGGAESGMRPAASTGKHGGGAVDPLDCGACIVTCWSATGRNGPSDWSGHAYLYNHVSWCGNGSRITYSSSWQSYDQSGWFRVDGGYGPWQSGGCAGCASIAWSGYMTWTESIPLIGLSHNGTTWLTVTLYAWGGSAAS
jgi:hypothetical protein